MSWKRFFPVLEWLPGYSGHQFKGDLSAGITVGVMLIPQGMAYAMLAGLNPIHGLYAVTVPLIIYGVLGTSRQLAVGPVAMIALITASGLGAIASPGSGQYFQLAVALALLSGLIQLLLGIFRLGFLVNFLSHPVISGFTSAAALIIGFSQLKHLLGVNMPSSEYFHEILLASAISVGETNPYSVALGIIGIAVIIGTRKIHAALPGPLLAVVFGVAAVVIFDLSQYGIKTVGQVPGGLPTFFLPRISAGEWQALLPLALTISLVGFMESIAVAKAIQSRRRNYQVDADQELLAIGAANIAAGVFRGFPVTGGFSRTAVNDQAGAQTGMASVLSAGVIIMTLLFLTPLFYHLPNTILASVVMVAVFGLIDFKEPKHLWHSNRADFFMLLSTFVATLTLGIEKGIGLGVVLSLAMVIYRSTRPHVAALGQAPGTTIYRNLKRFDHLIERPHLLVYRFDADLYFANANFFKESLEEMVQAKGPALKAVVISTESINNVDSSASQMIEDLVRDYRRRGLDIAFSNVKGPIRDALAKSGLMTVIGHDRIFLTIQEAVDALEAV
ncbi:MAG: SulP family inorganic anion transporter [Saprospiraceae bacterium]|jgi:SulP family sulfate permease